jgi:hypothetical protein
VKQFFEEVMRLLKDKFSFVKRGAAFDVDLFLQNSIPWREFTSEARAAFDRDVFEIRKSLNMKARLIELDMPVEHAATLVGVNN